MDNTKLQLADLAVSEMQTGLKNALPWLDAAYGRAERLVRLEDGRRYYTPAEYRGGNDYTSLLPDSGIGNYCFFWQGDPQTVRQSAGTGGTLTCPLSVIFWFDIRKISGRADTRGRDVVKAQILRALNGGFAMRHGKYEVRTCYELAENIFREFTLDETDNQYLMHPYCGLRFEGTLTVREDCYGVC